MRIQRVMFAAVLALGLVLVANSEAWAGTSTYFVGGDKAAGKAAASAVGAKWVKSLTKAFAQAANDLNAGGPQTVYINVAAGEYDGDLGSGAYTLPKFANPTGSLLIQGGWDKTFAKRDPFGTPAMIVTIPDRSAPLWSFARNSKLAAFIVDGLIFDSGASNHYDGQSNCLMIRGSCTSTFLAFTYLETNELAFENCVFMNSANRVMEPLIRAATPQAEIRYQNCMFVNNRIPLKLDSARFRNKPARIEVDHCSFLINWAYNPDPDTGNPAACELGNQYSAKSFVIKNSLYYANFGGAIMALNKSIALTCNNNNFVGNGLLHGSAEPDAAALILIAGNKKHPVNVDTIEDADFVTESEGNVSIAAGSPLSLGNVKVVDSSKVKAEPGLANDLNRLFGRNLQGGKVDINDYAPRQEYDGNNPPFPTVEEAKKYGASPDLVKD